jgi:hypothetical protein
MRQRFRAGGFGGEGRQPAQEGPVTRTVYVRDTGAAGAGPVLKAVTIKTGIADASFTEVLEGLKEGEEVVTGVASPTLAAAGSAAPQGRSPFGGGPFGGGPRR